MRLLPRLLGIPLLTSSQLQVSALSTHFLLIVQHGPKGIRQQTVGSSGLTGFHLLSGPVHEPQSVLYGQGISQTTLRLAEQVSLAQRPGGGAESHCAAYTPSRSRFDASDPGKVTEIDGKVEARLKGITARSVTENNRDGRTPVAFMVNTLSLTIRGCEKRLMTQTAA